MNVLIYDNVYFFQVFINRDIILLHFRYGGTLDGHDG